MTTKILFIERKFWEFVSIEKVFRIIAENLSLAKYDYSFHKLKYGSGLSGIIKNLFGFKKPLADIYHVTGHVHYIALVLPSKRTILTIHDLGFIHQNKGLKRYILKKLFLDLPVARLKYVTAISEATRDEIVFYTNCDINKIRVIENPLTSPISDGTPRVFNSECPTILQVGTSSNKNLSRVIEAVLGLNCVLDIVGKLSTEQEDSLKQHGIDYRNSFGLSDDEMNAKYLAADIVCFCSTFEGFGLPVLEGQAADTAVLASNIRPINEVAGEGAELVNPNDSKQIRAGILRIIEDEERRSTLIVKGRENVKRFDPQKVAGKFDELYDEVLRDI